MRIYLAGPLFSIAEKEFNISFAGKLKAKLKENGFSTIDIIIPQQYSETLENDEHFVSRIFQYCVDNVENSDLVVAILEGSDADSGTCVELGVAYARNIPIIGIRTDFRSSEDRGLNIMVANVCSSLIWNTSLDINELADEIKNKIEELDLY